MLEVASRLTVLDAPGSRTSDEVKPELTSMV
jgi:hypothetical protein